MTKRELLIYKLVHILLHTDNKNFVIIFKDKNRIIPHEVWKKPYKVWYYLKELFIY